MFSIRSQTGRGVVALAASLTLSAALGVACAAFDDAKADEPATGDAADASASAFDASADTGIDPFGDASSDATGDGAAEVDASTGCSDTQPFGAPVELTDLGEVTSVRPKPSSMPGASADSAFVSFFAVPGDEDIDEGAYPKGANVYSHAVVSPEGDTHPAPVTSDLRLVYEHGSVGARQIVVATRAQSGQKLTSPAVLPLALAGAQTREPWALGDGSIVYFTMEPGANGARDVYRAELIGAGPTWNVAVVAGVSTTASEGHPVVSDDELTIFFSRTPNAVVPAGIWTATRATKSASFGSGDPVPALNGTTDAGTTSDDRPTWLSADRCTLLLVSNRSGAYRAYAASRH
jgi:hypothetical protein